MPGSRRSPSTVARAPARRVSGSRPPSPSRAARPPVRSAAAADEIFVYARLSENPDGTRTGVDRQITDLFAATDAEGIPRAKVCVFREDDRSASIFAKKPRPEFERMLREAQAERPKRGVWFWKLDRGFRRGDDWQNFLTVMNATERDWRSIKDGLDTRSGDRDTVELLGMILVWQAQKESKNTSVRQKRKQEELALLGRHSGGGSPAFGHTGDWRKTIPKEARLIRVEAKRLLAGVSIGSVARRWNAAGVPTATMSRGGDKAAKAERWTPTVVKTMFTSYRLAGAREWDGRIIVTGEIAPILDLETVERLRAKLLNGPPRPDLRSYLLSGLLFCELCGHRLHAKAWYDDNDRRIVKFWCPKSASDTGCGHVSITYRPLEQTVVAALLQALVDPAEVASDDTDYDALREEIGAVRERLAELAVDRYARGLADYEFNAARAVLIAEEAELVEQLGKTPLREVRNEVGDDPRVYWSRASEEQRHDLLRLAIDRITVGRCIRPGRIFDASRIEIAWNY